MVIDIILIGFLALMLLIQVVFIFGVFGRFGFASEPEIDLSHEDEGISIVIAAHNELPNLRRLLPRLDAQDYPHFEVIIVDDRSTDETYDFLLEDVKTYDAFRLIRINEQPTGVHPKKYALTLGIKAAYYEKVLLTDADCLPLSPQWVRYMANAYQEDTKIVVGYSPQRTYPGLLNQLIRYETFMTGVQYLSLSHAGLPYMGVGRNLSYKRDLFVNNKGYGVHSQITGGDDDLFVNMHSHRENTISVHQPESQTITEPKHTWEDYWRQKTRHLSVSKYYRTRDKLILGAYNFSSLSVILLSIGLAFKPSLAIASLIALALRWGGMMLVFSKVASKLGEKHITWAVPFMDILYQLLIAAASINGLTARRIKWR